MKTYVVRIACEVAGAWRKPGVPFPLTDEQARYLAPPYGSAVAPFVERPKPAPEKRHGRQRRS